MSKLLSVFGATGQQGGALIKYILDTPELSKIFKLRGITRDITKPSAAELRRKGIELVQVGSSTSPKKVWNNSNDCSGRLERYSNFDQST